MSKYTPAPWILKRDPSHFDTLTTIEAGIVGNRKPFMLVQVGGDADFFEAEANARLIAAAPDLLQTLKVISVWAANGSEEQDFDDIERLANKAIEKATDGNDDSRK